MLKAIQIMRAKSLAARGDHEGAAQAYLKAGDEAAAAAMFLKAGRHDLARIHFERAGDTAMALEAARAAATARTVVSRLMRNLLVQIVRLSAWARFVPWEELRKDYGEEEK